MCRKERATKRKRRKTNKREKEMDSDKELYTLNTNNTKEYLKNRMTGSAK